MKRDFLQIRSIWSWFEIWLFYRCNPSPAPDVRGVTCNVTCDDQGDRSESEQLSRIHAAISRHCGGQHREHQSISSGPRLDSAIVLEGEMMDLRVGKLHHRRGLPQQPLQIGWRWVRMHKSDLIICRKPSRRSSRFDLSSNLIRLLSRGLSDVMLLTCWCAGGKKVYHLHHLGLVC